MGNRLCRSNSDGLENKRIMATITQRKHRDDRFKVSLRLSGHAHFGLTFTNYRAAVKWLEEHENKYYKDPQEYINWKDSLFFMMRNRNVSVWNDIVRPKMRIK